MVSKRLIRTNLARFRVYLDKFPRSIFDGYGMAGRVNINKSVK